MIKLGHNNLYRFRVAILAACVIAARTSSADVVYIDLEDFYFGPRGPAIDVNGDQVSDFRVGMGMDCSSGCSARISGLAGNGVASVEDLAIGLPAGAPIGPQLPFLESAILAAYMADGCFEGEWCGQTGNLFLGVRFRIDGGTHYGWIRTRNMEVFGILVLDCAFETEPDMPIAAGEGWHCPDVDQDGLVGLSDLAILLAHFGSVEGNSFATGDLNGDTSVNLTDLAIQLANFGTSCSP